MCIATSTVLVRNRTQSRQEHMWTGVLHICLCAATKVSTFPRCCEPHGVTTDASPHIFVNIGRTSRNICFPPEPRTLLTVHTGTVRVRRFFWGLERSSPVRPRPFCTFATSVRDHLVWCSGGRRGPVCFGQHGVRLWAVACQVETPCKESDE